MRTMYIYNDVYSHSTISSEVHVNYDTGMYINSLEDIVYLNSDIFCKYQQ